MGLMLTQFFKCAPLYSLLLKAQLHTLLMAGQIKQSFCQYLLQLDQQ